MDGLVGSWGGEGVDIDKGCQMLRWGRGFHQPRINFTVVDEAHFEVCFMAIGQRMLNMLELSFIYFLHQSFITHSMGSRSGG